MACRIEPNNLISGRHSCCQDGSGNLTLDDSKSLLYVFDTIDQKLCVVPLTPQVLNFFGLRFEPVESPSTAPGVPEDTIECEGNLKRNSNPIQKAGTSKENASSVAQWGKEQEESLIAAYKEFKPMFGKGGRTSKDVWLLIRNKLAEKGKEYDYTRTQVENKWKNLRKAYTNFVDSMGPNNSGGSAKKAPPHFEEMDEILGLAPQIKPAATASSRRPNSESSSAASSSMPGSTETSDASGEEPAVATDAEGNPPPAKKTKIEKALGKWANNLAMEAGEREKAKAERHQEMLNVYKRMADTHESAVNSLNQLTQFLISRGSTTNQ